MSGGNLRGSISYPEEFKREYIMSGGNLRGGISCPEEI